MNAMPVVRPARPEELGAAFRLVFQDLPPQELEARLAVAQQFVERNELHPEGVLVADGGSGLLGALLCLPAPGASGLLWPPRVLDGPLAGATEDLLLARALAWLRSRGARLAQALLPPGDMDLARPLERNGLRHVTSLWYLAQTLSGRQDTPRPSATLSWKTYAELTDPTPFGATLLRTYEKTQDCPEVSGVRTLDEVLAGHRAQGRYDPANWWLASGPSGPVGVLLATEIPDLGSFDISYVGIVPEERGRGHARTLMQLALAQAVRLGVPRVTLSVDQRNRPAWQLYRGLGFEPHDRREVFLLIWG